MAAETLRHVARTSPKGCSRQPLPSTGQVPRPKKQPKKYGPAAPRSARGLLSGYTLDCREWFTGFALSDS